ncbi:hypothetical protein Gogos_019655 [Gossypium gossypioides]|uniref:Uncharacterized protein n=1 Tax=Gossypium gossypioides TaxID=34282 RepID=A0A7J9BI33_GOSGO|nr:hypothetical protein [Gossypium gossypioides]
MQLNHELTQLKRLCNNILNLMTNYASGPVENLSNLTEGKALDLLPARTRDGGGSKPVPAETEEETAEDLRPKLFGDSIGMKRVRREVDGYVDDENRKGRRQRGPYRACFEESRVGEPDTWRHMKYLFWMLLECKAHRRQNM